MSSTPAPASAPATPSAEDSAASVDAKVMEKVDATQAKEKEEKEKEDEGDASDASSSAGKIAKGEELKQAGNALLKAGEFKKAAFQYRSVFLYVNGLISKSDDMAQYSSNGLYLTAAQEAQVKALKVSTYNNLALAYLKQDSLDKAVDVANKALVIDETCAKALFRKGQAQLAQKKFDPAKASLLAAAKLQPQDRGIRAELDKWKAEHAEWKKVQDKKQKEMFALKF